MNSVPTKLTAMPPTPETYNSMQRAYEFFNARLFGGQLPDCLITLRGHTKCAGYYSPNRFRQREGEHVADEIAFNPLLFGTQTIPQVMSTLVHEMCHLWQKHFGKPCAKGHNREWAEKMKSVGLQPSHTGMPGGKETGPKMSDYIIAGGVFESACNQLIATGFVLPYAEHRDPEQAKKKRASKTKYTCGGCSTNAWAKPGVSIRCEPCDETMTAQSADGEDE